MNLQWHLVDREGAGLYCRAWMALTRGSFIRWPPAMMEPLLVLQNLSDDPDTAAVASCVEALSSVDSVLAQWKVLSHLETFVKGVGLARTTQRWLIDSIIECLISWEVPQAVIEETAIRATPSLLRVLHLTQNLTTSDVRNAAALALHVLVCGPVDLTPFRSEARLDAAYCELTLTALSSIVDSPGRFGATESILQLVAQQLSVFASPFVAQSERFPPRLHTIAGTSLAKLYIDGRIDVGVVDDSVLADVLHLLFPPSIHALPSWWPSMVATLVGTLERSAHPSIASRSVRLLEALLTNCSTSITETFARANGINAVLRTCKAVTMDNSQLPIDGTRTLFTFLKSCTSSPAALGPQLDLVFQSDFIDTFCSMVASEQWWLFQPSCYWKPVLIKLCRARPREAAWITVLDTFQDFTEKHIGEERHAEALAHLDAIIHDIQWEIGEISGSMWEEGKIDR